MFITNTNKHIPTSCVESTGLGPVGKGIQTAAAARM